ncbi:hypothetical protein SteCoe_33786 [Stentor coeruleus]|uniref:Uncharacterized protein n=1 Tax=Stentor coeruleus TaxID=5963 RepID=A0A1R2AVY1_9CILI|nr:hypothetical protein SteCoe_33786 [Stentor coeruleus]
MSTQTPGEDIKKTVFTPKNPKNNKKFIPNQLNQASLSETLYLVLDFFYHSRLFSQGFQGLTIFNKNLLVFISKAKITLLSWQEKIDSEIQKAKTQLQELENSYESLKSGNEPVLGNIKIPIFTEIDSEFIEKIRIEAEYVEKEECLSKKIVFMKSHIEKLEEKKKALNADNVKELEGIEQEYLEVVKWSDSIKSFEEDLALAKTYHVIVGDNRLRSRLRESMGKMTDFAGFMGQVYRRNAHFLKDLILIEAHPDIYSSLSVNYSTYAVEKTLEPVFEQDLSNLRTKEISLKAQIDAYSPVWLIKHFQKNITSIYKSCCDIVDVIMNLRIICQDSYFHGITGIKLSGHENTIKCHFTLGNYKTTHIRYEEQRVMFRIIKLLYENLCEVIRSLGSMWVIHDNRREYTIRYPFPNLKSSETFRFEMVQNEYREHYNIMMGNIKNVEYFIMYLTASLQQISIKTTWGMIRDSEYRTEYDSTTNSHRTVEVSSAVYGIKEAYLLKPAMLKTPLSFSIKFPNHTEFKNTMFCLKDTIEKIAKAQEKIKYKDYVDKQIQDLHNELTYEFAHQAVEKELSNLNKEFICLECFYSVDVRKFSIKQEFYLALLGSFVSRINFRKSKVFKRAEKIYKRTKSTVSQFIDAFWKVLQECQYAKDKTFEGNFKLIAKLPEINIESIVKFLVSESIIGSFMNDQDRVQDILNGKIMENCEKSWFIICSDAIEIIIIQMELSKGIGEKTKRIRELEEEIEKKLPQYQSGCVKKIQKYFKKI